MFSLDPGNVEKMHDAPVNRMQHSIVSPRYCHVSEPRRFVALIGQRRKAASTRSRTSSSTKCLHLAGMLCWGSQTRLQMALATCGSQYFLGSAKIGPGTKHPFSLWHLDLDRDLLASGLQPGLQTAHLLPSVSFRLARYCSTAPSQQTCPI